jgi:hypothetical protein
MHTIHRLLTYYAQVIIEILRLAINCLKYIRPLVLDYLCWTLISSHPFDEQSELKMKNSNYMIDSLTNTPIIITISTINEQWWMIDKEQWWIIYDESKKVKMMRRSGIEPEAKPWKGFMLPLHQRRCWWKLRKQWSNIKQRYTYVTAFIDILMSQDFDCRVIFAW